MGCDIHLYVEHKINGRWVTSDTWSTDYGDKEVSYKDRFYSSRNYDLFAILADVRNGHGFAGIKTGEGFVPIAAPKGVPDDCCQEYRDAAVNSGVDGHSHSYFTIDEIMKYDWTQVTKKTGIVDLQEWAHWKVNGSPDSWSGAISGPPHIDQGFIATAFEKLQRTVSFDIYQLYHGEPEAIQTIATELRTKPTVVTRVNWEIPYYKAGHTFLAETLPRLWRLGKPEDVRILFFFDN